MEIKRYRNNKNHEIYFVVGEVIDSTNVRAGTVCVLYHNGEKTFVREKKEFLEKFTLVDSIN